MALSGKSRGWALPVMGALFAGLLLVFLGFGFPGGCGRRGSPVAAGPDGVIAGVNFHDKNGNSVREAGEPGLPDWTLYLDENGNGTLDEGETLAVTGVSNQEGSEEDLGGRYRFTDLEERFYTVQVIPQAGWTQTVWPSEENSYLIGHAQEKGETDDSEGGDEEDGGSVAAPEEESEPSSCPEGSKMVCDTDQGELFCDAPANISTTPSGGYRLAKTCKVPSAGHVELVYKGYIHVGPNYISMSLAKNNGVTEVGTFRDDLDPRIVGPQRGYSGSSPSVSAANCNLSPCTGCAASWPHAHCPQPYRFVVSDLAANDTVELWVTSATVSNVHRAANSVPVYIRDFQVRSCKKKCVPEE